MLDAIARAPLWEHGLDYGHGTGHGVGYFLNVHEGPQTISRVIPDANDGDAARHDHQRRARPLSARASGACGSRTWCSTCRRRRRRRREFGEFLEFETLTLCPIDTRCIEPALLRADEIAWLDAYHRTVRERLEPQLTGAALAWLRLRTAPLS